MPITVNENGSLYTLTNVYANEGGSITELSEVWANEGGMLCKIHNKEFPNLFWRTTIDARYPQYKYNITSVSSDGWSYTANDNGSNGNSYSFSQIQSDVFHVNAGTKLVIRDDSDEAHMDIEGKVVPITATYRLYKSGETTTLNLNDNGITIYSNGIQISKTNFSINTGVEVSDTHNQGIFEVRFAQDGDYYFGNGFKSYTGSPYKQIEYSVTFEFSRYI